MAWFKKKKNVIKLYLSKNTKTSHRIYTSIIDLNNEKTFKKCREIIKRFAAGDELFFHVYRKNPNITNEQFSLYEQEISDYFKKYGKLEKTDAFNIICCIPNNENAIKLLPKIFDCYLETIFFVPKISWEEYKNNFKTSTVNFIKKGCCDIILGHVDNGEFLIEFNSSAYDKKQIYNEMNIKLNSDWKDK